MNANRFNRISQLFANRRLTRRQAMRQGAAGLTAAGLAATGLNVAKAQDGTPAAEASPAASPVAAGGYEKTMYLFVQSFQSGSIAPIEGIDDRYTVTLEQGLGQTIYFADRPSRDVGTSPTPDFLAGLGFSDDNPPNAALLLETASGETDIAVVELFNPSYDEATHTATYEVAVLENWQDSVELGFSEAPADLATLAPEFGAAHLFIDDCADSTIACDSRDGHTFFHSFVDQPFCWNYGLCVPCEPYGHTQPDRCSTPDYWYKKCNDTYVECQNADGGCMAVWDNSDLLCAE